MADLTADLSSLRFERGLSDEEKTFVHLRARSAGLAVCGAAHATFLCELARSLRRGIKGHAAHSDLCLGILGLGHMGKQLLHTLLEKTDVKPSHIKISTRSPESAVAFVPTGVECFFDNRRLAAWADVLFLCCLPSHLQKVSTDLRSELPKRCLVYSFTSAVPVTRLAQLLGHDFIVRPQYVFVECDAADVWLSCTRLDADPSLVEASCPLTMNGGISLGLKWVCAVLYSLLNICTSASLGSSDALAVIKHTFKEKWPQTVELNTHSFISSSCASSLLADEPFPWISLTDVQNRETPLLRFLSSSAPMQRCISAAYRSLLEATVKP